MPGLLHKIGRPTVVRNDFLPGMILCASRVAYASKRRPAEVALGLCVMGRVDVLVSYFVVRHGDDLQPFLSDPSCCVPFVVYIALSVYWYDERCFIGPPIFFLVLWCTF